MWPPRPAGSGPAPGPCSVFKASSPPGAGRQPSSPAELPHGPEFPPEYSHGHSTGVGHRGTQVASVRRAPPALLGDCSAHETSLPEHSFEVASARILRRWREQSLTPRGVFRSPGPVTRNPTPLPAFLHQSGDPAGGLRVTAPFLPRS